MPPFLFGRCRFLLVLATCRPQSRASRPLQFALTLLAAIAFASLSRAAPPEPTTLKGHTGWVGGVAFSPDGETIATASADKTVKFWNATTGKELATLDAHDDIVTAVAFSKDGAHFATASFDGTAKVWTAANRKLAHTFRDSRGAVLTVAFNPNGRALASGGIDGAVRVWELDSGKAAPGRTPRVHRSWVNAVAYRPDGEGLASVGSDNEIRFNPGIGRLVILRPKLAEVRCVAYSPDGKFLAAGTRYGITKVWDNNGDEVASLKGKHGAEVWGVAFSPDGKLLATADGDWNRPSDVVLWEVPSARPEGLTHTWKERARLRHTNEVLCVAFHPKKPILAAGAWDKTVKVWDLTELLKADR